MTNNTPITPLRIATWNVDNLGMTHDRGQTIPPAVRTQKIKGIAWAIGHDLQSPHIVALQEICGDRPHEGNQRVPATENTNALIRAIKYASGAKYEYIEIPPQNNQEGGAPDQNIRCGYLYRTDRVALATNSSLIAVNPTLIAPQNPAFQGFRRPLVVEFTDKKTQEHYCLTNLHLPSNGRIHVPQSTETKDWTHDVTKDWKPDEKRLNIRRTQASLIRDFQRDLLAKIHARGQEDSHHVICLGDFNTASNVVIDGAPAPLASTEALDIIGESGLINVADERLKHQYSVGDESKNLTLDHMFVSAPLRERIADAQRPKYTNKAQRISDHNPTIISFAAPKRERAQGHAIIKD